ncbi:hypothetical protein B0H13DRAFT_1916848 [Mycena leptocephala]|nr:hypothetical protein B0H13DRAFT_1916848 [Mycena leptocephala]
MPMTGLLLSGIYEAPHAPSVHGLERESLRQLLRDFPNFQWSLRIAGFCSDTVSFKFNLICMQSELEVKDNVYRLKYRTLPSFFLSSITRKRLEGRECGNAAMLRIQLEHLRSEATIVGGRGVDTHSRIGILNSSESVRVHSPLAPI